VTARIPITLLAALALALPLTATAQEIAGPPGNGATRGESPRISAGVSSLKLSAHHGWTSTGLRVRKGETVRIRAWGRARIAAGGGALTGPEGIVSSKGRRLLASAALASVVAVVGEDNNEYIAVGREAEFVAARDGMVFLCLNQLDPAGNLGEYDVRATVGHASSLTFGAGATPPPVAASPPRVTSAPDGTRIVTVSPTLDWTNTYVTVKRGDTVEIEASGRITLDLGGRSSSPDGIALADPGKLLPDKPTGALVAVVGDDNNDFIFLGSRGRFVSERTGLLFLGINEEDLANNTGSFSARVKVTPAAKR
jgi:hypothetical protein